MFDVLTGLLNQIDLRLVALSIIAGYLVFFFYYYKTERWNDFGWSREIFFGSIIGVILVFLFLNWIPIVISSWFEIMRGYYFTSTNFTFLLILFGAIFLVLRLIILRQEIGGKPLQSFKARLFWYNFFKHNIKYLITFLIFLGCLLFWIQLTYPFSKFLVLKWLDFFIKLSFGMVVLFVGLPTFLSILTYLLDWNLYVISGFWDDIKNVRPRSFVKVFTFLLILFLSSFLITYSDSHLGILTPKVTMQESVDVIDDTLYFWRAHDNSTTVLSSNSLMLHIVSPLVQGISINQLTITNPSNYTTSIGDYKNKISSSDGLDCSFSIDERAINVKINNMTREDQYFTLTYYYNLNVDSLVSFKEEKFLPIVDFENGTFLREYTFEFSNLSPYNFELEEVYLVRQLHNITSYTTTVSDYSGCYCTVNNSAGDFVLEGHVQPESSFKVSLQILYTYWE
jgi:hypothetical protein